MIYYETVLAVPILLAIILVVAGLLVKEKTIRWLLWLLSLPVTFLIVSIIQKHSNDVGIATSKFCGDFIIDIDRSKYDNIDLARHKNLVLKVTKKNAFYFSGDTIPFVKQLGTWEFTNNEDGGYVELFFDSKKIKAYRSFDNNLWRFESDCLRNADSSDIIYFKREK